MSPGDDGGARGRHRRRAEPERSIPPWRRRVLIGVGALVVAVVVVAGAGFAYVDYRFHQIRRVHVAGLAPVAVATSSGAPAPVDQAPETILLIGDNCRNCLAQPGDRVYGTAAEIGGGRSDVTMLLRVYPATSRMSILSIPRDLWLPIPGTDGQIRVDAALNEGPSELVKTISDDLDVPINHYIELNFDTFADAVNAIGGLDMGFPTRVYDSYSKLNLPAGCYHLDGAQALQVVRARHLYYQEDGLWRYDGMGDLSRIQRDHEFLRILAAAVSAKGLANPITDNRLISGLAKDLTIDTGFGIGDLAHLAEVFSHVDVDHSPERTLPVDIDNTPFVYRGEGYGDVVFPSNRADLPVLDAFLGPAAPAHLDPSLPVTLLDASGSGRATGVAAALRALGFRVTGLQTRAPAGDPAESVVYYAPGHEAAAASLAAQLGGAVALGEDSRVAGAGLTVLVGTNLTVTAPATSPATSHSPTAPPSSAPIGGVTQADAHYPSFDPAGCRPGARALPPPHLAVPTNLPGT